MFICWGGRSRLDEVLREGYTIRAIVKILSKYYRSVFTETNTI